MNPLYFIATSTERFSSSYNSSPSSRPRPCFSSSSYDTWGRRSTCESCSDSGDPCPLSCSAACSSSLCDFTARSLSSRTTSLLIRRLRCLKHSTCVCGRSPSCSANGLKRSSALSERSTSLCSDLDVIILYGSRRSLVTKSSIRVPTKLDSRSSSTCSRSHACSAAFIPPTMPCAAASS